MVMLTCAECGETGPPRALYCPADGRALTHDGFSLIGHTLEGSWHVERLVGAGAMATVYAAHAARLSASGGAHGTEQEVAIKLLRPKLARDHEASERFRREAELSRELRHPGIVPVFAYGHVTEPTGGASLPFLVSELVPGDSLDAVLRAAGGALSLEESLDLTIQIADVIGAAHAQDIVHRDIKPANVMLSGAPGRGRVRVLDFGLGRSHARASALTRRGALYGTPEYMSPEAARGEPTAAPSDVYALATLLYRCLVGRTPFAADSPMKTLLERATRAAPRLEVTADGSRVPASIADVVAQNLEREPERRAANASVFRDALLAAGVRNGADRHG